MAGRASLFNSDQERILIAVVENIFHSLHVAGGFALLPEFLTGTAPEPGQSGLDGSAQGLGVHVRDHQYFIVLPVLDHGRDEPFVIVVQVIGNLHDWTGFIINQKKCPEERSTDHKKTGPT